MNCDELFEKFSRDGRLVLPKTQKAFGDIAWVKHAVFDGVEMKHIVTAADTGGQFSFHLVKIEPNKKIGEHVHKTQLETHEVISGSGVCVTQGGRLEYKAGTIAILPMNAVHEVAAGESGLCLFAKFMPALC